MGADMSQRVDRLFRLAGVTAASWAGVPDLLAFVAGGPAGFAAGAGVPTDTTARVFFGLVVGFLSVSALAVSAGFWWLTAQARRTAPRLAVIATQGLIGLLADPTVLVIVAAELPFVAAPFARRILVGQVAAFLTLGASYGTILGTTSFAESSTTLLLYAAWQVAAYLLGTVAVREAEQRRDLETMGAALVATRELLAEGGRLSERMHLSREIHDGLGHNLAALGVNLDLASRTAGPEEAGLLRQLHAETRALYREVREVVGTLRHQTAVDVRQALAALAAGCQDPRVDLELPAVLAVDDMPRAEVLMRCVRRALSHAREGRARRVLVSATQAEDGLAVEIRNGGRLGSESLEREIGDCLSDVGGRIVRTHDALTLLLPRSEGAR